MCQYDNQSFEDGSRTQSRNMAIHEYNSNNGKRPREHSITLCNVIFMNVCFLVSREVQQTLANPVTVNSNVG
jgi:hypothetical protein